MARKSARVTLKHLSEINLTPFTDMTFLILVTFIITFPLIEQSIPVDLPKASAQTLTTAKTHTVTLNREGQLFLNDHPVTLEELGVTLGSLVKANPDVTAMVRADAQLPYGDVVGVIKVLRKAGVVKLGLVTQGEEESQRP